LNGSLKFEHLDRLEIPDAVTLADETATYRAMYNGIRPHEALDFATPLSRYRAPPQPHLFQPESVQNS
jgi:hypothetical protein